MDHVAIMRRSWMMIPKILSGEKTIESRWYKTMYPPWGRISAGDTVYFKDSGRSVEVKAEVDDVAQFDGLTPEKVKGLLDAYGKADGIDGNDVKKFFEMFKNKRYCVLVFLKGPQAVEPFEIDKTGFGAMASWLVVKDIEEISVR